MLKNKLFKTFNKIFGCSYNEIIRIFFTFKCILYKKYFSNGKCAKNNKIYPSVSLKINISLVNEPIVLCFSGIIPMGFILALSYFMGGRGETLALEDRLCVCVGGGGQF